MNKEKTPKKLVCINDHRVCVRGKVTNKKLPKGERNQISDYCFEDAGDWFYHEEKGHCRSLKNIAHAN